MSDQKEGRVQYNDAPDIRLYSELSPAFMGSNGNAGCRAYVVLTQSNYQAYDRERESTRDVTGELFSVDPDGEPTRIQKGEIAHAEFFWDGDDDQPGVNIRNRHGDEGSSQEVIICDGLPASEMEEVKEHLRPVFSEVEGGEDVDLDSSSFGGTDD